MSRVEITATNAAGDVFIGRAEIEWQATSIKDVGISFKPKAIHEFMVYESDGSCLGVMRDFLKPGGDDDQAETEG